jgi:hypothetical protein
MARVEFPPEIVGQNLALVAKLRHSPEDFAVIAK